MTTAIAIPGGNTQTVSPEQIERLVTDIWEQTLRLPVQTGDVGGAVSASQRVMAAYVQISGGWNGAVVLTCTAELAATAAATMFSVPPDAVSPRDELDALGELSNIIGGSIKALLPGPSHLSLPTVVGGESYAARVPGSRVLSRHHFESGGALFAVSLLEREQPRHMQSDRR